MLGEIYVNICNVWLVIWRKGKKIVVVIDLKESERERKEWYILFSKRYTKIENKWKSYRKEDTLKE